MKNLLSLSLLALLLSGVSIAGPPADDLSADVGEAELRTHVKYLASDDLQGRRAGKPGAAKAAAYIVERFESAGLEPLDGSWTQPVPLPFRDLVTAESRLRIRTPDGEPKTLEPGSDWLVFPTAHRTDLEDREVVFAGYGIKRPGWNDYADVDVKGKVVLILRHGPGESADRRGWPFVSKHAAATRAGAAGIILVNDRAHHPDDPDRPEAPGMGMPEGIPFVFAKAEVATALLAAAGHDFAGLQAELDRTGKPRSFALPGVKIDLRFRTTAIECANVVGILPGSDEKLRDEVVVVGGHYDHVGTDGFGALDANAVGAIRHGADDNASGTAGVIELAEHFALTRPRPRRTLLFIAFTGEELGLVGSAHYVAHPLLPLDRTVGMVNLDMIGRSREGALFIGGTGTSPVFDDMITRASKGAGLTISRGEGGAAPSDNTSFFLKGIPTLFFFTGVHADYHRATDTWEKLEYGTEKRILDVAARIVREIADLPERPKYVRNTSGGFMGGPRGPRLGVVVSRGPGRGVGLDSIQPGSPAAKAGLRSGDRILSLGGDAVKDLRELIGAIRKRKFGDVVDLTYLRDGREQTTKVTFEKP